MKRSIGFVVCGLVLGVANPVHAQTGGAFGIGPRVTFQRGDESVPDSSALRVLRRAIEAEAHILQRRSKLSADYESSLDESLSPARPSRCPFRRRCSFSPSDRPLSPYLLGGVGWYRQKFAHGCIECSGTTTTHSGDGLPRGSWRRDSPRTAHGVPWRLSLQPHSIRRIGD